MLRLFSRQEKTSEPLLRSCDALARRAHFWLYWERYAPVLSLAVLATALFLAGAYIGLWQRIGDPWRLIALCVTLYFIVKAVLAARKKRRPTRSEAQRRIERDSGVFGDNMQRLRSALSPSWQSPMDPAKVTFDAWGSKRRIWNLVVLPDTAPQVDWVSEPKADKRDRLSFQYSLKPLAAPHASRMEQYAYL